MGKKLLIF